MQTDELDPRYHYIRYYELGEFFAIYRNCPVRSFDTAGGVWVVLGKPIIPMVKNDQFGSCKHFRIHMFIECV